MLPNAETTKFSWLVRERRYFAAHQSPDAPVATCEGGMDAKKRKREEYESDTVTYLRRGTITILDALDVQLPDVFAAEILPKLSLMDTLNLAQVSKAYRDSVWSVRGVQSLEAKIAAHHLTKKKLRDHFKRSMRYATKHGNLPAIRALLQSGVDVNEPMFEFVPSLQDVTALWFASHLGHAAVVKELIEAGADVNVRASAPIAKRSASAKSNTSGVILSDSTPLFAAAHYGHTPVVIELIKAGADVNVPRSDGTTPLHMAASKGHEACVVLLIQAGADVNAKAQKPGWTPLSVAIDFKHEKVVKLLKHFGAR